MFDAAHQFQFQRTLVMDDLLALELTHAVLGCDAAFEFRHDPIHNMMNFALVLQHEHLVLCGIWHGNGVVDVTVAHMAEGDDADAGERFEMAKHFMRNTINTFLGGMGSGLINQVDKCTNIDELRQLFGSWKEAIELSGDGRKQLADLEARLAALLS